MPNTNMMNLMLPRKDLMVPKSTIWLLLLIPIKPLVMKLLPIENTF